MNAMKKERITIAKALGILFDSITVFYVCYFIWSVAIGDTAWYQLINCGTQVLVVAWITYAIHSEIRGRVRYTKHNELYDAVDTKIAEDKVAERETTRVDLPTKIRHQDGSLGINVHGAPGLDPRKPYENLPDPGKTRIE